MADCQQNPALHIRATVFGCASQEDFALILGTTQASVSRWEKAGRIPGHKQEAIRAAARTRDLPWQDRWFFVVPSEGQREPADAEVA